MTVSPTAKAIPTLAASEDFSLLHSAATVAVKTPDSRPLRCWCGALRCRCAVRLGRRAAATGSSLRSLQAAGNRFGESGQLRVGQLAACRSDQHSCSPELLSCATRSDPLQTILMRRACADVAPALDAEKSAALIKTNPTEWKPFWLCTSCHPPTACCFLVPATCPAVSSYQHLSLDQQPAHHLPFAACQSGSTRPAGTAGSISRCVMRRRRLWGRTNPLFFDATRVLSTCMSCTVTSTERASCCACQEVGHGFEC